MFGYAEQLAENTRLEMSVGGFVERMIYEVCCIFRSVFLLMGKVSQLGMLPALGAGYPGSNPGFPMSVQGGHPLSPTLFRRQIDEKFSSIARNRPNPRGLRCWKD